MKRKSLSVISILLITVLTACGAASQPTLSVTDIQNTAFPLVMTQYAQTKTAAPTATAIPSTPTALATFAPLSTLALNTQVVAPVANPNASPTPDCGQPPPAKVKGTTVQVKLVNQSGGPVNLFLGMFTPNSDGECYEYNFNITDKGTQSVTILSACYWGYGYQTGPKPSTPATRSICLTDTNITIRVLIGKDTMGIG